MAANTSPIFGLTPKSAPVTFVNADGTGLKTVYTPGTDGGRLEAINVATDDTAAVNLQVWVTVSAVDYLLGTITVPIGSGNTGTVPAVNILDGAYIPGLASDGSLTIPSTVAVKVKPLVAVTAAKTVYVVPVAVDF